MIEIFEKLLKNNNWSELDRMDTGFPRSKYLQRIQKYIDTKLIKVIVGQRRSGKSYLLRQIIQYLVQKKVPAKNIFYLNKELLDFDDIRTYKDLHALITFAEEKFQSSGKMYIFLDEIQQIENWEKIVNSLSQDHRKDYELFITGSNSTLLSSELATLLSGRYIEFEVLPFSFTEYRMSLGLEKNKISFLTYLKSGGLPELIHLKEDDLKRHYVASLRDTILLKDIIKRWKIKDPFLLEEIFLFLADNSGNLFSVSSIVNYLSSKKFKTNYETMAHYLQYLCQTFLIHEVKRFDLKGKSILGGAKKYYLNDLSFRNYLLSSFDLGLGKNLESAIYMYFLGQGYSIHVGTINHLEIDFILEKGQEKKYIQSAYSLGDKIVVSREITPLQKIHDAYEKIIISLDDVSFGNIDGIKHVLAWELED